MMFPLYTGSRPFVLLAALFFLFAVYGAVRPATGLAAVPSERAVRRGTSIDARLGGMRFTETRPHTRQIDKADAETVAVAAARDKAARAVMREMVSLPEIRIAGAVGSAQPAAPSLLAVARAAARTRVLLVSVSKQNSSVTVTLVLDDSDGLSIENRIREVLLSPDRLKLYEEALLRETALVAAYDESLPMSAFRKPGAAMNALPRHTVETLRKTVRELRALDIFMEILPSHNGVWRDPAGTQAALHKALALAPDFALARNALGDVYLQTGRSQEAVEQQTLALKAYPEFARAYHSRGMAAMPLGHLSTAAADFSEAIRLAPATPAYHRDRGMLRHLLGETGPMCEDLYRACALGDCSKYHWASSERVCEQNRLE